VVDLDPIIIACEDCDPERRYYQMLRWREAASVAVELFRPRWWEKLLGRQRSLPTRLETAVRYARELDGNPQ
jgi:hypothetical protein